MKKVYVVTSFISLFLSQVSFSQNDLEKFELELALTYVSRYGNFRNIKHEFTFYKGNLKNLISMEHFILIQQTTFLKLKQSLTEY